MKTYAEIRYLLSLIASVFGKKTDRPPPPGEVDYRWAEKRLGAVRVFTFLQGIGLFIALLGICYFFQSPSGGYLGPLLWGFALFVVAVGWLLAAIINCILLAIRPRIKTVETKVYIVVNILLVILGILYVSPILFELWY